MELFFDLRLVRLYMSPQLRKVFVLGFRYSKGAGGNETREPAVYEFLMTIANYAPSIEAIDTYVGEPHDEAYEAAQEAKKGKSK